jgi:hypothetical protein
VLLYGILAHISPSTQYTLIADAQSIALLSSNHYGVSMSSLRFSPILSLVIACSPPENTTEEMVSSNEIEETAQSLQIQSFTPLHFFPENSQGKLKSLQLAWHGENYFPNTPNAEAIQNIDWTMTPNLGDKLHIHSSDRLYLTPSQDVPPNTTVSVTVKSITLANGAIVTPNTPEIWTQEFVTPEFKVAYSAIKSINFDKNTASISIKTSHTISQSPLRTTAILPLVYPPPSRYWITPYK